VNAPYTSPWKAALVRCISNLPDDVMQHEALGYQNPILRSRWHGAVSTDHPAVQSLRDYQRRARPHCVAGLGVNRSGCEARLQNLGDVTAPVVCTVCRERLALLTTIPGGRHLHGLRGQSWFVSQSDLILTHRLDVVELFDLGVGPYHQRVLNIDSVPHQDGLFQPDQRAVGTLARRVQALTLCSTG